MHRPTRPSRRTTASRPARTVPLRTVAATVAVTALAVGGVASVGVAWAGPGAAPRPAAAKPHQVRVVHYYAGGPGTSCHGGGCGGSAVAPTRFTLPAGSGYQATVSLSLQYVTSAKGRFQVGLDLTSGGRHSVTPGGRALRASVHPDSTTVEFRVQLQGGRTYGVAPTVDARGTAPYRLATSKVVLVVDATPA
jgi:hypothetical protein